MYKDAHYQDNTLSSMFRRVKPISSSGTGDLHPGQLYNWQAANVYNDRDYAIEVIYVACKFCWSVLTSVLYYRRYNKKKHNRKIFQLSPPFFAKIENAIKFYFWSNLTK